LPCGHEIGSRLHDRKRGSLSYGKESSCSRLKRANRGSLPCGNDRCSRLYHGKGISSSLPVVCGMMEGDEDGCCGMSHGNSCSLVPLQEGTSCCLQHRKNSCGSSKKNRNSCESEKSYLAHLIVGSRIHSQDGQLLDLTAR
jgi:hypothetical protein